MTGHTGYLLWNISGAGCGISLFIMRISCHSIIASSQGCLRFSPLFHHEYPPAVSYGKPRLSAVPVRQLVSPSPRRRRRPRRLLTARPTRPLAAARCAAICSYFAEVLKKTSSSCMDVTLHQDGSWREVSKEVKEKPKVTAPG